MGLDLRKLKSISIDSDFKKKEQYRLAFLSQQLLESEWKRKKGCHPNRNEGKEK